MSSRESGESNDSSQLLVEIGTQFLQRRVHQTTIYGVKSLEYQDGQTQLFLFGLQLCIVITESWNIPF